MPEIAQRVSSPTRGRNLELPAGAPVRARDGDLRGKFQRGKELVVAFPALDMAEVPERLVAHRAPSTIGIVDLRAVAALPWDGQPGRVFD